MPEENSSFEEIQKHRSKIDDIDRQIVALLNERTVHSLAIRNLKPAVNLGLYDPRREEEIFERINGYNEGPLYNEHLRDIYTGILRVMKGMPSA